MKLAMVGLGKMGANMTARLLRAGHRVVAFDMNEAARQATAALGAEPAVGLEEAVGALAPRRVFWIMLPAGEPTESTVHILGNDLEAGDIVVDGGNSHYKDSVRRAAVLKEMGISFVDVGTSGGVWGIEHGYSLMVGGEKEAVEYLRPLFEALAPAPDQGWGHVGPSGAGHYVKMVHNGIEYALMEAYAEGFELMSHKAEFQLDLRQVAEVWRYGSVVRSWLLDLAARALAENPTLGGIAPYVADSGEGRWTAIEAIEQACPAPVITLALENRFRSREQERFGDKLLAALRQQFGGHAVKHTP